MLERLNVGKRLAIGFGLVITLSLSASAISIWQLKNMASQAEEMSKSSMVKERLVSDLNLVINAAVRRTSAIAKSKDDSLAVFFTEDAHMTTAKASDILEELQKLKLSDEEQAIYKTMTEHRAAYTEVKEAISTAKKEGQLDKAQELLEQRFSPAAKQYLESVAKLLEVERKAIDHETDHIQALYRQGAWTVALSSLLIAAVGMICSLGIGKGLLAQLGGEPIYAAEVAKAIASGKLNNKIHLKEGDQESLLHSMQAMQEELSSMVEGVRLGAGAIAEASSVMAQGNADLSRRTEDQAASLEETAASMDELTLTVKRNVSSAVEAKRLAESAADVAVRGGNVVKEVVQTMGEIRDSSKQVEDIISVIDTIAFQTNILALNAAVEAARAGEEGRGFAVVASEVRALAQRSASAAKEIKTLINKSVETVNRGTELVSMAGDTMEGVVEGVLRVSDLISSISKASSEQSDGIGQVDDAINHMDKTTQQNASLVEQAAAASELLKHQAEQLMHAIAAFELDVKTHKV